MSEHYVALASSQHYYWLGDPVSTILCRLGNDRFQVDLISPSLGLIDIM